MSRILATMPTQLPRIIEDINNISRLISRSWSAAKWYESGQSRRPNAVIRPRSRTWDAAFEEGSINARRTFSLVKWHVLDTSAPVPKIGRAHV